MPQSSASSNALKCIFGFKSARSSRLATVFFFDDDDFVANVPFELVMVRREDLVNVCRGELGPFEIKSYSDAADEAGFSREVNPTVLLLAWSSICDMLRVKRVSSLLAIFFFVELLIECVSKCFCFGFFGWGLGCGAGSVELATPRTQASMSRVEIVVESVWNCSMVGGKRVLPIRRKERDVERAEGGKLCEGRPLTPEL